MNTPKGAIGTMVLVGAVLAGFGWSQFGEVGLGAGGHEHEEHEGERGAQSLPEAIARKLDSRILEVEYEREGGRAIYEIKLEDEEGRHRKLLVDAETGEVIGRER